MPPVSANPYLPHSRHKRSRDLVTLPQECTLPAPKLPAGRAWSAAERALWRDLWSAPQASQWDDSYAAAVAQYVVHACAVVAGEAAGWQAQECRYLGDRLGLTPAGLASLGWRLSEPGAPTPPTPLRSA